MTTNKKKILVVDDDPVVVKAFTIKLKASNYEVVTAFEGAEAVNIVRTQKPDAILLDINFPNGFDGVSWDGFRIMDWLKRIDEAANIPVFIISSGDAAKYQSKSREAGAAGYFQKPIIHEELIAELERVLNLAPVAVA
jgi:two-component system response regulator PrrA